MVPDMDLDDVDRAILASLLSDARASQRQLSRDVGVAQGTITNRIRRMEELGIIKGYSVVIDPESVGWNMTIMAGLRIAKGMMICLLYTSPSPRDKRQSRMPSSA